ncbi:DUF4097 family beta strand repeat-containing protein [Saccharothrix obliqua]|uniref:DUF4097 family beta strand repeat-containing protein n=1 Tax=Saccharothrix obliqua TaxID=2861747 RepID=UPI001C5EC2C1|nr:DUF4097 family beta strand repeat-containing protein [Saccharothrix obliqua]MBW4717036.1 DUF4097 domain-containing protein [Saccharothrix obliqua]
MPEYETPEPISVTLDLSVGNVRFTASDRTTTAVDVRPTDENDESDVAVARQVRVDHANGVLRVTGPKPRMFDFSNKSRSVDVHIELPSGSRVSADAQAADFRATGRLGECRVKISVGNFSFERTGPLRVQTVGHITVEDVEGGLEASTGTGKVRIGRVDGTAVVKNSNGATLIDTVTGDLRVRAANGDIEVERATADVDVKTSNGAIRLGEVVRGSVVLASGTGDLEVGIAEGTAAWLELNTSFGHLHNRLENTASPEDATETVQVRGRTSHGDITVHRA